MTGKRLFDQIFLTYFGDKGYKLLDYYSYDSRLTETVSTKTASIANKLGYRAGQMLNQADITGQVCVDNFPDETIKGRVLWYAWKIEHPFSADQRVLDYGTTFFVHLWYPPKNEKFIGDTLVPLNRLLDRFAKMMTSITTIIQKIAGSHETESYSNDDYRYYLNHGEISGRLAGDLLDTINEFITALLRQEIEFKSLPTAEKLREIIREEGRTDPGIVYLIVADARGLPYTYYARNREISANWLNTITPMKIHALQNLAVAQSLEERIYSRGASNEELDDHFNQIASGKVQSPDPGIITHEVPRIMFDNYEREIAYAAMSRFEVKISDETSERYFLLAGCTEKLPVAVLRLILERTKRRIISTIKRFGDEMGETGEIQ